MMISHIFLLSIDGWQSLVSNSLPIRYFIEDIHWLWNHWLHIIELYIDCNKSKGCWVTRWWFQPPWKVCLSKWVLPESSPISRVKPPSKWHWGSRLDGGTAPAPCLWRQLPKFQSSKLASFLSKRKVVETLIFYMHHYVFPHLMCFPIILVHLSPLVLGDQKRSSLQACSNKLSASCQEPPSWELTSVKGGFLIFPLVGVVFPIKNRLLPTRIVFLLREPIFFGVSKS